MKRKISGLTLDAKFFALSFLGAMLLVLSVAAQSHQGKVYHVGILAIGDTPQLKGFREGLKNAGYVEGKNLVLDISVKQNYDELRPIAKAYVEKKLDVIVGIGTTAPLLAKELTREIPIIFAGASDPMASGLVKSLAQPEANVTGVSTRTDFEMHGKRLEIFKEAVPSLRRVAVLYNARGENPGHAKSLALVQKVAPDVRVKLIETPIKSTADLDRVLSSIAKETADGLFPICATIFRDPFKKIATVVIQKKLALMGCGADQTENGALLSYDANRYRVGQRAAWYVERILKGTKPRDLPVEAPIYFELTISLKTAKQIGLTIPPNVLARADRVIR
jgi:putative tryptophan/tyrosine transport system substrate-binding protein